jgi:SAM-dependent methyltransferase
MLMNSIEYWLVNNPLRGFVQRHYETPRLKRLSKGAAGKVLEIGCGQGTGARIIYELFSPQRYVGIDLDPRMIGRASRVLDALPDATFVEGDVTSLEFPDSTFDLVMDFGIIHHVPNWRDALAEVHWASMWKSTKTARSVSIISGDEPKKHRKPVQPRRPDAKRRGKSCVRCQETKPVPLGQAFSLMS